MSERLENDNTPEKKQVPLTDDCDGCEKRYALTDRNAYLFHYSDQDELDHLYCVCPNCNYRCRMFINEATFQTAVDNGIGLSVEKYAPDHIHAMWLELNGYTPPATYELTDRHEALIHRFGEAIVAMPPELFWDNIEAETDKPYPLRWI